MVMVLWTWSLLQYAVVLTTSKELPKVENNIEAITAANADSLQGKDNTAFTDVREASPAENETVETGNYNFLFKFFKACTENHNACVSRCRLFVNKRYS